MQPLFLIEDEWSQSKNRVETKRRESEAFVASPVSIDLKSKGCLASPLAARDYVPPEDAVLVRSWSVWWSVSVKQRSSGC